MGIALGAFKLMNQLEIPMQPVLVFLLVLARVGGLVTFAPFWSHLAANGRVRAMLAFMLALVITPAVMPYVPTPPTELPVFIVLLAGEIAIGFVFGFVGRLVFSAIEMAAQTLTFQMGFSLASTIDPATQAHTAALGTVAQMAGLMILLGGDGHHWFLLATVKSFHTVAPGTFALTPALMQLLFRLSSDALIVGVALAAPAIVVLLAVEFALAIFGQAAPQFQIFLLGFPIKIAVGLSVIGASLYFMPGALRTTLSATHSALARALAAM